MNVLVVGKNKLNGTIESFLRQNGCNPTVVEDIQELETFQGQQGNFTAKLKDKALNAQFVVLTQQPSAAPAPIDGGAVQSLYQENKASHLPKNSPNTPIVFLLDYFCESPMAATIRALADAKQLADKKRKVYYLARFIRTAGHEIESMYKETRNSGVTFLKYEDLTISYEDASGKFAIKASDGVFDIELVTGTIFADGGREVGEDFSSAVKKMNLWPDKNGYLVEDRHFLSPVLTSRKGVYHISRDLGAERLQDGLDYIWADVSASKLDNPADTGRTTAVVDGEKCVLCYSCFRACPHAAMQPDNTARVMENLSLACEGCGICASVCPGNAITLSQDLAPTPQTNKANKTLVLCCENSAALAMEKVLPQLGELAALVDVQPVPCGGRIGLEQIADGLGSYGKVLVAVCIDDACKHFDGNKRACLQTSRMADMLTKAGLSSERVGYTQVSHAMPKVLRDILTGFVREGKE